jgi:hypothetical protein
LPRAVDLFPHRLEDPHEEEVQEGEQAQREDVEEWL